MPRVAEKKPTPATPKAPRAKRSVMAPEAGPVAEPPGASGRIVAGQPLPARFAAPAAADDRLDLGLKLKRMRSERSWTLEEVSRRTGVARSTLSKIENGQMSPTYDVLQRITRGMELDLVELFDTRRQTVPFGRRSVIRAGGGESLHTSAYHYEVLATDLSYKRMLPFKAKISARSLEDFPDWVRHEGEEFLCVLSGQVEVHTEFYAPVILKVGDSIYFDSTMGHALVSVGADDAEVLWICTSPAKMD